MIFPREDASLSLNVSVLKQTKSITLARFTKRTTGNGRTNVSLYKNWIIWGVFLLSVIWNDFACFSTCSDGKWNCKSRETPATCAVEEGSHVTTFDGKTYTFHGDCYYTLAKVEHKVSGFYIYIYNLISWKKRKNRYKLCCVWLHFYCLLQDDASPKFTILVQLVPCANQEFDTCLRTLIILINNDRNNVSYRLPV